ncbi:MAG: hypothetical protein A2901_03310 [Elusimicrobia bacterium RIFCSPLOWO2_01_FULL_54_10]|nr:MAG: hypothetical protein A2901_03310 [Elusimicrobia bacterium RIFCSPLOWO2_01_FULL_54_10]
MAALKGVFIAVTRARGQASGFAGALRRMGARVLICPTILIAAPASYKPLDRAVRKLESYDWLIFTSANAVESFAKRLRRKPVRSKTCAIGPGTAASMKKLGIKVTLMSKNFVAESILKTMPSVRGKRILIPRAKDAREILPRELRRRGAAVDAPETYKTVLDARGAAQLRKALKSAVDCVTFTSASTVHNFFKAAGRIPHKQITAASIGPITTQALLSHGWKPAIVAKKPTTQHLAQAILKYYRKGHL